MRWIALGIVVAFSTPSYALCSGASVSEEFRDADVVVRARLVSGTEAWSDEPSKDYIARWGNMNPAVLYELKVDKIFKGAPENIVSILEERNSGAFYLDVDKDYLLFLKRLPPNEQGPTAARDAYFVEYACGQSMQWDAVQKVVLSELEKISGKK
jgi:hypothetical protein